MIRRFVLGTVAVAVVLAFAAVTGFAQVGELRGHVFMQTDGAKTPLGDAQIDVFRTDVKGQYQTKTNKKGEFVFAGLPFVGEYTIAASHPTAAPNFITGFKVGRGIDAEITVTPGNGHRLTLADLKSVPAAGAPGNTGSTGNTKESDADRAKREELIRKNKEIEENNKKITESNVVINRTFKAGNDLLTAAVASSKAGNADEGIQKFTEAIAQYDEGLAADAEQPALLTNKAQALKGRAIERFNLAVRSKNMDEEAKKAALELAKTDFRAASVASNQAVEILKKTPAPTDPTETQRFTANKYAALATNAEAMRLFVSKVDPTQADAGINAFREYVAVEQDPAKKIKAQLDSAQMLLDAGAADKAFTEFQGIVTAQPDNPEANLGAGLALFASGDKAKYQDAANYLQHFVDIAPDTNTFKADAKAILAELKNTEKVVPDKTPPRRKRP